MAIKTVYLAAYNLALLVAWGLAAAHLVGGSDRTARKLASHAQLVAAALDVVHLAAGLTRSGLVPLLIQQGGRIAVLWLIRGPAFAHESALPGADSVVRALLLSYAAAEVVRAAFYVTKAPAARWLRYSAFLVLYPVGLVSEALVLLRCHSGAEALGKDGDAFHARLQWVLFVALIAHPVIAYVLFTNMLRLRAKNLGGADKKAQ